MNLRQIFKLRLIVAAIGESTRMNWWNSNVLSLTGEFLFKQGFPRSTGFAQTRACYRAAELACNEALGIAIGEKEANICHLFKLPIYLEDAYEDERRVWMDETVDNWSKPFRKTCELKLDQWPEALIDLADLNPEAIKWAKNQSSEDTKAICIGKTQEINQMHIERLTAGFICGQKDKIFVPYIDLS